MNNVNYQEKHELSFSSPYTSLSKRNETTFQSTEEQFVPGKSFTNPTQRTTPSTILQQTVLPVVSTEPVRGSKILRISEEGVSPNINWDTHHGESRQYSFPFDFDSSTTNHQSIRTYPDLPKTGMARPNSRMSEGNPVLAQYANPKLDSSNPLYVDTDMVLSLVHETRPSYMDKTLGKKPFSPSHLMSLVGEISTDENDPFDIGSFNKFTPKAGRPLSASYAEKRQYIQETNLHTQESAFKPLNSMPTESQPSRYLENSNRTPQYPKSLTSGYSPNYDTANSSEYASPGQKRLYANSTTSTLRSLGRSPSPRRTTYEAPIRMDNDDLFAEFEQHHPGRAITEPPNENVHTLRRTMRTPPPEGFYRGKGPEGPYTSPQTRGSVPPPTDQPVRAPKQHGIEGQVDHLTCRMLHNMNTGEGAAGDNNCAKCGEGIGGPRPGCTALNQAFHLDCFICHVCGKKLAGGSFYAVDGKPHCEEDYMDTLDKCDVCKKPITDRILRANDKPHHPNCFLCAVCRKCLDGVPFTVDTANVVHCVTCFHDKFAPRCAVCSKPIVPEEGKEESLRVVAMDRSYHLDCYKCEDCGLKLSSKIEGHECYPLDEHLLCKNCNLARVKNAPK